MSRTRDYISSELGYKVGADGAELTLADSDGHLYQGGTEITASAAELNIMDGVTKTAAQINQNTQNLETIAASASSSSATALLGYGVSVISSTLGAAGYYALAAPVAGATKTLYCSSGSTTNTVVVYAGSAVTFDGTNHNATFNAEADLLDLVGLSATRWLVKTNGGSVALST